MMAILNNTGAGRACYLQLFNADKETIHSFLLTPELAGRLGWSLTGVMNGFEPAAMAFEDDDDEDEDDDEDDEDDDE